MTREDQDREDFTGPYERITAYTISALAEGAFVDSYIWDIQVAYRGKDRWAVLHAGSALSRAGEWDWEPSPSSRDDEWLDDHRFAREEALELARAWAPLVRVNGRNAEELVRFHEKNRGDGLVGS